MSKDIDFCHFQEFYSIQQIRKTSVGYCFLTTTSCSKSCFQKVVHKAAAGTGEFIGNKIPNKIVKPKPVSDENLRDG